MNATDRASREEAEESSCRVALVQRALSEAGTYNPREIDRAALREPAQRSTVGGFLGAGYFRHDVTHDMHPTFETSNVSS